MIISKIYLLIPFILPSIVSANAKVIGNGGNIVVCENSQGKIIKTELLDLFEGRAVYGLNYTEEPTPALTQALKYADTMSYAGSPVSAENISVDIKDIYNNLHFLPPGVGLQPIADSDHFIIPKGCRVVQTVNYRGWKNIFVDSDIWKLLSETQKAALLLHEAIFAYYREGSFEVDTETTSTRARLAVASLFAGVLVEPIDEPKDSQQKPILHCTSDLPVSEFFVYRNNSNKYIAQFRYFFNHVVLTRSWIESNNAKLISGDLISPFESGVRLQISFQNENEGTIFDLNASRGLPAKFKCDGWQSIY